MGLKERLEAKYAGRDWAGELAAALDEGDELLAWTTGRAAAAERRTSGFSASARVQSYVVTGLQNTLSKANHVGGDRESIAASLPLAAAMNSGTLVLSAFGLSVWHFAPGGATPPSCTLRIARADITSISRMDARGQRRYELARVLFRDGSFFDYYVTAHESAAAFWSAASLVGPSA